MVHAMKRGLTDGRICCSHLVVAHEGLYMITVHPIWALQSDQLIDWTLHEQYQSFDVVLGGIPETRQSPLLSLSQYQTMTERMGMPVQFSDDIHVLIIESVVCMYIVKKKGLGHESLVGISRPMMVDETNSTEDDHASDGI